MARKPNKKGSRRKPPSVGQRRKAEAKRAAARGTGPAGQSPRSPNVDLRVSKAQAAWDQHRYDEAIWQYERALARDPHNPVLLTDVARAYALRFRFADAEKLVDLANSLHPDDARLQEMLGHSYEQIKQFDRAIACLRRSLELAPDQPGRPQILLELAKMYERLHDLENARKCAEEVIALAPTYYMAQYVLANIDRRAGDLEGAEAKWKTIIDERKASLGVIADSWYQLAALYDKAGQYEDAYEALDAGEEDFQRRCGTSPGRRLEHCPRQRQDHCHDHTRALRALGRRRPGTRSAERNARDIDEPSAQRNDAARAGARQPSGRDQRRRAAGHVRNGVRAARQKGWFERSGAASIRSNARSKC